MKFSYFSTNDQNQKGSKFGPASIARSITGVFSAIAPRVSGLIGEQLLLRPYGKRHYNQDTLQPDSELQLTTSIGTAHVNLYGSGTTAVILSHGWADTSQTFKHVIPALVKQGYLVAAFDHIGHGKSTGKKSHLASFIETKACLLEHFEKQRVTVKAIIGHSMGAVAALNLSELQLKSKKIILIASPVNFFELMFEKIEQFGISHKFAIRVLERITKQYGLIWHQLSPDQQRSKLNGDVTFIHDKNDRYAPFSDVKNYLGTDNLGKQSTRLIATEGLGHSRILGDTNVINSISQVLQNK